jgi:hypothetical protein
MSDPVEGYILHTYGPDRFIRHAVASVLTLRRYDRERPVALYCPRSHRALLERHGLDTLFQVLDVLPEPNRSIVGFKHRLHEFMPFDRNLFLDSDMIWCRDPDPLWTQFGTYSFTATGLERSDFFFGGPKGIGVVADVLLDRRRRTMRRFGLTHLPRVQAGMIYASDHQVARTVCETAESFLDRRSETHFRSRLSEGRSEESCEWSIAMAMSRLRLPVFPWFQGFNSPQLDFIEGLTTYDANFEQVACRYYSDRFVYSLRGLSNFVVRDFLISAFTRIPGHGDHIDVTPFVLHFGWLRHKKPFFEFSTRVWEHLGQTRRVELLGDVDTWNGSTVEDPSAVEG